MKESSDNKKDMPQLWYWSQPENGFSFEDVEMIAEKFVSEAKRNRYNSRDNFLHIAFV